MLCLCDCCAGVVSIFAPTQQLYKAAADRVLGLAGESIKARRLRLDCFHCALTLFVSAVLLVQLICWRKLLPALLEHSQHSCQCIPACPAPPLLTSLPLLQEGEVYHASVVRLLDYGAMLQLTDSGMRALLHISEISPERVRSIEEALQVGQELEVLCLGRDQKGHIKLSRKALLVRAAAQQRAASAVAGGAGFDVDK